MALNFPDSPNAGDAYTSANGYQWVYDGNAWVGLGQSNSFLPLSGGQLTGPLLLNADPAVALGAATKEYTDAGDALALKKAGDTMTGRLTLPGATVNGTGSGGLTINGPASAWPGAGLYAQPGQGNFIAGSVGGNERWELDLGDGSTETGSNTGSNFQIARFDDGGNLLDCPIIINRQTGRAALTKPLQSPAGDLCGLINKIVNGSMNVAQRGASFTATTGSAWTLDRWLIGPTGASVTVSQGGWGGPGNANQCLTVTGAAGVTNVAIIHRIESLIAASLNGQNCTFSAYMYHGIAGVTINPTLAVYYPATADSYSSSLTQVVSIGLQPVQSGVITRVAATFAMPAAMASLGCEVYLYLGALPSGAVSTTQWDLRATPSLPVGLCADPPPPETRPVSLEFLLCQRYYETGVNYMTCAPALAVNGIGHYASWNFRAQKRAAPTMTYQSAGQNGYAGGPSAWTANATMFGTVNTCNAAVNGPYYYFNWQASADF